jgi:hypothetical protein
MPASYKEMLTNITTRLGKTTEQIRAELQQLVQEEEQQGFKGDEAMERALRRLLLKYKRELSSPAVWLEGVFVGDTGKVDIFAKMRTTALQAAAANIQQAIQLGLVDVQGRPLDRRPVLPTGAPNPNFGKPIPDNTFVRMIFGATKFEDRWYATRLVLATRFVDASVPLYQHVKFRANIARKQDVNMKVVNYASVTQFEVLKSNLDIESVLREAYKPFTVPLAQIEKWHQEHANLPMPQRTVFTEGDVIDIRDVAGGQAKLLLVWDDGLPMDKDIPVFYRGGKLDFGPESRILIIGRTGTARRMDLSTGQRIAAGANIAAVGIYAIPRYKTNPLETLPTAEVPIPEIEEWQLA